MRIGKNPALIGDSIIFEDSDGFFIYSQNQKKVAWLKDFNNLIAKSLEEKGFFMPLANHITNVSIRKAANMVLLLGKGCPMYCRYCYANGGASTELMPTEIADQAILNYLSTKPPHPKIALFGGGEPTLNVNAIQYIIGKYGKMVRWCLTTSGVLPPNFLEWLIEQDVMITFSIDGPPEIQNYLRPLKNGDPSSSIVERSMRIWTKKTAMPLSVRATITEESARRIDDILAYFDLMGVKSIHLEPLYNLGRATELVQNNILKQVSAEKWTEVVIKSLKWAREKEKHIQVGALTHLLHPALFPYCGPICGKTLVINHKGKLTACSEVVDEENKEWDVFSIGELRSKFWFDEQKLNYLANRVPDKMMPCQNCFARYLCRGGCAHKGWQETGNLFLPDPHHCDFIKAIIPLLIKRMAMMGYMINSTTKGGGRR